MEDDADSIPRGGRQNAAALNASGCLVLPSLRTAHAEKQHARAADWPLLASRDKNLNLYVHDCVSSASILSDDGRAKTGLRVDFFGDS